MRYMIRIVLAFALLSCAPYVLADSINVVPYASLTGTALITFEDIAGGPGSRTNYDGILTFGGASFAERFLGQTLSFSGISGNFDVLSGAPVGPLALQVGAAGQNLSVTEFSLPSFCCTTVLSGLGPLGFPAFGAIGEGSVAVLFVFDQSQFGFEVRGGAPPSTGSATLNFFRRDGSLIQTIVLTPLVGDFGFERDGSVKDIAGVSIHNNDSGGIAFDDFKYDVPATVPEPSTLVLLGVGAMAGATRRWVRRKRRA